MRLCKGSRGLFSAGPSVLAILLISSPAYSSPVELNGFSILFSFSSRRAVPESGFEPRSTQLFPCAMTRYSTPIKVSGVLGIVFMQLHGNNTYSGFFAQIEPGIAGGKINAGYRYGEHHFLPVYNIGLAVSLMQTWSNPLQDVEGGQTYIGLELSGAFSVIGLNGGVFKHIAGDDEESNWIYSLGIGVGI